MKATSHFEPSGRKAHKETPLLSRNMLIGLIGILLILVVWAVSSQFSTEPVTANPEPVLEPNTEVTTTAPEAVSGATYKEEAESTPVSSSPEPTPNPNDQEENQ